MSGPRGKVGGEASTPRAGRPCASRHECLRNSGGPRDTLSGNRVTYKGLMTEHHGRRVVNKNGKEHLRGQQVPREMQGWGLEVHFPRLPHTSPNPPDSTKELTWKETRTVLTPGMLGYY